MKYDLPYVIFEATSACNLDCLYCYNIWKIPGTKHLPFNSYKQSLKTLKRLFKIANVSNVTFTGGEPLLAERISEQILFCRMKKVNVTLITNGNSATKEKYKELIDLGIGLFELPLHSNDEKIHDYLTRKPGSHSKVVKSIKKLQELNANVVVDVVLNKLNLKDIEETLSYIKSLGLNRVMLTRFNVGGEGLKHIAELLPSIDELKSAFAVADRMSDELDMKITSNVCTPLCVLNPNDYKNITTLSCSANIRNMPLTLDINGNVRICNHSPVYIGNIFEQSFEELSNSGYVKSWKEIKPDYCDECNVYNVCFGGCRAASEQMGFGLKEPDPLISLNTPKHELETKFREVS
ncbi:MAG: radical SAM protein [bacterium]